MWGGGGGRRKKEWNWKGKNPQNITMNHNNCLLNKRCCNIVKIYCHIKREWERNRVMKWYSFCLFFKVYKHTVGTPISLHIFTFHVQNGITKFTHTLCPQHETLKAMENVVWCSWKEKENKERTAALIQYSFFVVWMCSVWMHFTQAKTQLQMII